MITYHRLTNPGTLPSTLSTCCLEDIHPIVFFLDSIVFWTVLTHI